MHHVEVNDHLSPFASLLPVVDPSDDGYQVVEQHLVVQAVLAVETNGVGIVFEEEVVGVHRRVVVAEEAVDAAAFVVVDVGKAPFGGCLVFLDQRLGDDELLLAVLSWVLEGLLARHAMFVHGLGHLESRVHADAVEAFQQLSVHAAHGRSDDQVGAFSLCGRMQQVQGFLRMDGQVGADDGALGHHLAQQLCRMGAACRSEAVHI